MNRVMRTVNTVPSLVLASPLHRVISGRHLLFTFSAGLERVDGVVPDYAHRQAVRAGRRSIRLEVHP